MDTLHSIIERAGLLSDKKETGSITPEEVGALVADLASYTQSLERDGSTLGIRKVYPTMDALTADSTAPAGLDGKPLRRGNLVAIYQEATANTDTNSGLVLMWTGEGFTPVARIGTALRHENTALDARIAQAEGKTTALEGVDAELRSSLKELASSIRSEVERLAREANEAVTRAEVKADEALGRLEYTEDERGKVSKLKVDGEAGEYLGADGGYHALPKAPEYSLSVGEGSSRGSQKITLEGGTQSSFVEIKTSGSGGGFLNITKEVPLGSGYYTLERAVGALQTLGLRGGERSGLIISFEVSEGKWEDYRYVGDATSDEAFASVPMWVRYAPEVDTKQIQALIESSSQKIELADTVDESDRPVTSRAVKAELDGVKNFTLQADEEPTDEGTKVTLTQDGRVVTEFTVAGGGGSATSQATRAVVQAELSHKRIKLGDKVSVKYGFTHYVDGEPDGTGANLTLEVRKGLSLVISEPLGQVSSGSVLSLDLSKYITTADAYSVSVVARYEYEGEVKTRRTTAQLSVVELSLMLSNLSDVESYLSAGGYKPTDPANLIVAVKGGAKEVEMYIDGVEETKEVRSLTGSGGRQTFSLSTRELSPGSHSVQFVASIDGLKSNSVYLDVLVAGGDQPFVGLLYSRPDGRILRSGETPTLLGHQYEGLSWSYIAIGTTSGGVSKLSLHSPKGESSIVAPRTYQQYSVRPMRQGVQSWSYELGGIRKPFGVEVLPTTMLGIGIKEGAVLELDAEGRSNVEAAPDVWTQGKVSTSFTDVDFSASGWSLSRAGGVEIPTLRLINGAKAEIGHKPFERDAKTRGLTLTFEARMTNVRRADEAVISCFDTEAEGGFAGFLISPSKVKMPTGGYVEFRDEEGQTIRRDLGLEMPYAHGEFYSLTLVVHPESEEKTVRLYINGVLSKADTYQDTIFAQRVARGILIDSAHADVELRHLRVYEYALTDDEVLTNYITDRPTLSEMDELRQRNDVLSDTTGDISHDKLRSRGKAVLTITMEGGVEKLWGKSTDTKTNYKFDEIIFRSPFGKAYDLKVTGGAMRRQGTSTSTYPIKNLRIYLNRKGFATKVYHNVGVGDEDRWLSFDELNLFKGDISREMKAIEGGEQNTASSKCVILPVNAEVDRGKDYVFSAEVEFIQGGTDVIAILGIFGGAIEAPYDMSKSGYRRLTWKIPGDPSQLGVRRKLDVFYIYLGRQHRSGGNGLRVRNFYLLQADELPEYYKEIPTQEQKGLRDANSYVMREGAKPMKVINLKTDYADSSMCYNTGTAILLNDCLVKNNPSLKNKGMQADASARMAIDGLPIDVFTSDSPDGNKRYCGQFQFNNDKSGSGYIFGQSKSDGSEIALEFINNMNAIGNFHITGSSVRAQMDSTGADGFDASLEFLFPEKDYTWGTAPENVKQAVVRLWQWVYDCTPLGLSPRNMTEEEVKRAFVSEKFKREVSQYFDVTNLTMWWVLTDYHLSVDQRVKNTFFRTWGDGIWWLTYYDGDTAFGKRNDAFLAYDYNVNRDTKDLQRSKFAFEGHNSRLWCLVLANLEDDIKQSAKTLRETLTNELYKEVFNQQMMGNWSERQYNKSGIYKYIKPTYTDYNGGGVMNYIFALNGNMYAYRNQLIERRFSMLDAKYLVGQYEKDSVVCYIGKGDIATQILATAGDEYYFGWKTKNGKLTDHQGVNAGEVASLNFSGAVSINDPIHLIGASRMRKLDLSTTAPYMQGGCNINGCKMLEELVAPTSSERPTQWYPMLIGISGLKRIDLTGQKGVTGTNSADTTTFDVSTHTGLQELKLRGTSVRAVNLGEGSLTTLVELPATLTGLRLRSLPKLTMSGLQVEDWSKITSLELSNCPQIDWRTLLERCTNVERIRIEGVDFVDDGTLLRRLMGVKGLNEKGAGVDTCELLGKCQLSSYIDDSEVRVWRKHFASLDIRQPEWTVIEIDESIADSANISNLDNRTGYKYGTPYQPSGHIARILSERFGCLGKQEVKGQMKVCRLHYENWTKYADGSEARLDLTEGDLWVYEPEYWYKGVNDIAGKKKYALYATEFRPSDSPARKISLESNDAHILSKTEGYATSIGVSRVEDALVSATGYTSYRIRLDADTRKVRFPLAYGNQLRGALFVDASGLIVGTCSIPQDNLWTEGMYVVQDVPRGAESLLFCVNTAGYYDPWVVFSPTDKIEDIEPEWVHHKPLLGGVTLATTIGGKLGSGCVLGDADASRPTTGISLRQARLAAEARGLRLFSYEMYKDVVNLYFAKNGTRETLLGRNLRADYGGATFAYGMYPDSSIANNKTVLEVSNGEVIRSVETGIIKALGYEALISYNRTVFDGYAFNKPKSAVVELVRRDGSIDNHGSIIGSTYSYARVIALQHGKYMDLTPVGWSQTLTHRYHADMFYLSNNPSIVPSLSGGRFTCNLIRLSPTEPWNEVTETSTFPNQVYRLAYEGAIIEVQNSEEYKRISNI